MKYETKFKKMKKTFQFFTEKNVENLAASPNTKSQNGKFLFPWWFKIIIYVISFLCMIFSVFFTILKGKI
jgi:hypothetical protein